MKFVFGSLPCEEGGGRSKRARQFEDNNGFHRGRLECSVSTAQGKFEAKTMRTNGKRSRLKRSTHAVAHLQNASARATPPPLYWPRGKHLSTAVSLADVATIASMMAELLVPPPSHSCHFPSGKRDSRGLVDARWRERNIRWLPVDDLTDRCERGWCDRDSRQPDQKAFEPRRRAKVN